MIVFPFALLGALWGVFMAKRRGGNRLDMAQYAAVMALIFAVVGTLATIVLQRILT
jgi:hypothetical protein